MATTLLALLDDIASVLDDISAYSKVAASKTAPVIGDDLALNAQQVTGVGANRELPIIWQVAKGSLLNKVILVPLALLISAVYPPLVEYLLIIGGAYLCYEGAEKLWHSWFSHGKEAQKVFREIDEKEKIRGAVRTDFILSAEIVVIALGAMAGASFGTQVLSLSLFAIAITVFIYGLVALIVKIDDLGLYWLQLKAGVRFALGKALLWFAPRLMKLLSIFGTIAMFLVGGGIIAHGWPWLHHLEITLLSFIPDAAEWLVSALAQGAAGLLIGIILVACIAVLGHARARFVK
jgi:predicted DNA repair protein MutK